MKGKERTTPVELLFKNAAYVPTSTVTLVSAIKMREIGGVIWDMDSDHLRVQKNRQKVCKIQVHYRLVLDWALYLVMRYESGCNIRLKRISRC